MNERHTDKPPELPRNIWITLIAVVHVLVFAPALFYGFVWDDGWLIESNPLIGGGASLAQLVFGDAYQGFYWRPLVLLSFRLDWWLGSGSPAMFHFSNILYSLIALLLLLRLLQKLGLSTGVQIVAGLLWLLHPVHVEPVAFISARDNILLAIFVLLAVSRMHAILNAQPPVSGRNWLGLLAFMGLALLCKEAAVVLPLIVLWQVFLSDSPNRRRAATIVVAGFAALLVPYFLLRHLALPQGGPGILPDELSWQSVAMPIYLLSFYLRHFLWPHPLLADRWDTTRWTGDNIAALWPHLLVALAVVAAVIWASRKNKIVAFWLGFALLSLAPVLNLLPTPGRLTSDTWLLLPSMGFAVGLTCAAHAIIRRLYARPNWRRAAAMALAAPILLAAAVGSVLYLPAWESSATLYHDIVSKQPANPRPYYWLGNRAVKQNDVSAARFWFESGIRAHSGYGDNYLGLALTYILSDERAKARPILLKLMHVEPGHTGGATYLARLALESGDYQKALDWGLLAGPKRGAFVELDLILSEAYRGLGDSEKAGQHLRRFCAHRPDLDVCRQHGKEQPE